MTSQPLPGEVRRSPVGRAAPPPPAAAGAAARPADALAGRGLPRLAGGAVHHRRSGPSTPSPATSSGSGTSTTSATCSPSTSTAPSPCAPSVIAVTVTVIDALMAFPIAFYMAKVASPPAQRVAGHRRADAAVGVATSSRRTPGAACLRHRRSPWTDLGLARRATDSSPTIVTLSYLWLPYMILPMYAGLERLPNSLLEASSDLGADTGAPCAASCCRCSSRQSSPARSSPSR